MTPFPTVFIASNEPEIELSYVQSRSLRIALPGLRGVHNSLHFWKNSYQNRLSKNMKGVAES